MRRMRRSERGQVLAIVAIAMVAIIGMVGLVIDGGYAWSRQRDNQNGADSAAKAGTGVIQHYLAGIDSPAPNDYDVACAVEAAAAANGVTVESAEYVDFKGESLLPNPVMVGTCTTDLGIGIAAGAQGVKATTSQTFDTFLVQVIGWDTVTTEADAIAVVGQLVAVGGALPVTFPEQGTVCDDLETAFQIREADGDGTYEPYEIIDEADASASNLAIVPLCRTAPGSVGWLDFGCGQNLKQAIENPCDISIPIPAWIQTKTGNVNSLEDEINAYAGSLPGVPESEDSVLAIPIHDFTCRDDLADDQPTTACSDYPDWSGNGNNLYYHIPYWVGFKIDEAHVQGGDDECSEPEGTPQLQGQGGGVGCLKGWFVDRFDSPGPVQLLPITPGANSPMMVTLIN
jgi:hypothetical protein